MLMQVYADLVDMVRINLKKVHSLAYHARAVKRLGIKKRYLVKNVETNVHLECNSVAVEIVRLVLEELSVQPELALYVLHVRPEQLRLIEELQVQINAHCQSVNQAYI